MRINRDDYELIFFNLFLVIVIFLLIYFTVDFSKIVNDSSNESIFVSDFDNFNYSYSELLEIGNISLCSYLSEKRLVDACTLKLVDCLDDDCFFDKARFESDENLCFKIEDENKRAGCSASIKISDIRQRAVLEDDISICSEFEGEDTISHCRDNYYIAKRFNNDDKSYCNNILNEVIRNECLK